jgi:hypothetical protein
VEVHVAPEADDAAVLSQGGELGGRVVGRRLEACFAEPPLELEGGGREGLGLRALRCLRRRGLLRRIVLAPFEPCEPGEEIAARPWRGGSGSSTTPPPSVSGGASDRITSRSPRAGTSGCSSRSWK